MHPVTVHTNCLLRLCLLLFFPLFWEILRSMVKSTSKTGTLFIERFCSLSLNLEDIKSIEAISSNVIKLCRSS